MPEALRRSSWRVLCDIMSVLRAGLGSSPNQIITMIMRNMTMRNRTMRNRTMRNRTMRNRIMKNMTGRNMAF